MAEGEQDPEQKTEQPTQKRLDEAMKKGNIPVSREVTHFFMVGLLAAIVSWLLPDMVRNTGKMLGPMISNAAELPADRTGLSILLWKLMWGSMGILAVPLLGAMVAVISASLLQNGLVMSSEPMKPQLSRISPLAGIKRLFSVKSLVELIKNLLKIGIVGYVAFVAVYPEMPNIRLLPGKSTEAAVLFLLMLAGRLTMGVAIAMFLIAILDLLYQRFSYIKGLRMTRQEIRDEYKQSEGDPHIKQRLRRLRMERAKNRMMQNVPKADVVITNPTHFAVALQYDSKTMKAPIMLAKGQDLVALKIRDIAKDNNIPIVENPPLARALFASMEIDQEIPSAHYEAVAKVISFVYQLKNRRA
ncbi:MAG: flagellar biosynthesis protein FlhB [Proteobacteria bacterium]|nr:flagellar biosynthesis protein FlhB [Pseudomonadota bacterium]